MSLLLAQLPNSHHLEGGKEVSSSKHAETQGPEERSHTHSLPSLISWGHLLGGREMKVYIFICFIFFHFVGEGGGELTTF